MSRHSLDHDLGAGGATPDFYTKHKTLAPGLQVLDPARLTAERPEDVVFNGRMTVQAPRRFLLVDHSIVRAMEKGTLGFLEVAGAEQPGIFKTLVPGTPGTGGH